MNASNNDYWVLRCWLKFNYRVPLDQTMECPVGCAQCRMANSFWDGLPEFEPTPRSSDISMTPSPPHVVPISDESQAALDEICAFLRPAPACAVQPLPRSLDGDMRRFDRVVALSKLVAKEESQKYAILSKADITKHSLCDRVLYDHFASEWSYDGVYGMCCTIMNCYRVGYVGVSSDMLWRVKTCKGHNDMASGTISKYDYYIVKVLFILTP